MNESQRAFTGHTTHTTHTNRLALLASDFLEAALEDHCYLVLQSAKKATFDRNRLPTIPHFLCPTQDYYIDNTTMADRLTRYVLERRTQDVLIN